MFLLQLVLDDGPRQQPLETVEQLEPPVQSVVIVETLRDHTRQTPFQLLDLVTELVEIVIKILLVDVHDVVLHLLERLNRPLELNRNLLHRLSQRLAFSASQIDLSQLVELHDGVRQVQDVVASL
jgi:hypothetical protein